SCERYQVVVIDRFFYPPAIGASERRATGELVARAPPQGDRSGRWPKRHAPQSDGATSFLQVVPDAPFRRPELSVANILTRDYRTAGLDDHVAALGNGWSS